MKGLRYTSIDEYIHDTEMDRNFTWGTDIDHSPSIKHPCFCGENTVHENWGVYSPHKVDRSLNEPHITHMSMFIGNCVDHFEVVRTIIP